MTSSFYPKATRYFATLTPDRPIFQGDIFRGAFGVFWRHPAAVKAVLSGQPIPTAPAYPSLDELRSHVFVNGRGYGVLLPQPCEYSEDEKGSTHPYRLVAPLFPLDSKAGVDAKLVREGRVAHTLWVPRWTSNGPQDYFADLRLTTSIDAAFVTRASRVAAMSRVAWMAMADRLSRYFAGIPIDSAAFALEQAGLHPDAASRGLTVP